MAPPGPEQAQPAATSAEKVRDRVVGQEASVYEYRLAVLDVENEDFNDFRTESAPSIENLLLGRPNEIII